MKPKLIVILTLIVVLPLAALGWLGLRVARQEREVNESRFREALLGRLRDIDGVVLKSIQKRERELLRVMERDSYDAADLRDVTRKSPIIHALFVLDAAGKRLHPPPDGPITAAEREFLEKSGQVWRDRNLFYTSTDATGVASNRGWYTWYWGNGVNFLFWLRDASGRVIGADCDRPRMLADIVGELPNSDSSDPDLQGGRIAMVDGDGTTVYQWGAYDPAAGGTRVEPRVRLALSRPLNAWSLVYYTPPAGAPAFGGGLLLNLAAGGGALVLALVGLAAYFYRESTREMREAAQRVSFVNQVSHELKTPLTNIRMYAELLEGNLPEDDGKSAQQLGVIVSESQRLSRLIGNVLTFARSQNDKLSLHPSSGSVDECIRFVLDHFAAVLESRSVKVAFSPGAGASVAFDRDALEQILGNLLSNVEKYSASGGVLEVESRQTAAETAIVVRDRGPGIPKGQEERIFEPFHRLSNKLSDGVTGTGIGLAIARDLARKHGGELRVMSSNVGACFELTLRTPSTNGQAQGRVE